MFHSTMTFPAAISMCAPALTREQEAYEWIRGYIVRTGQSPSINELMAGIGVGKTRAKALVHRLAVKKMIDRTPGAQRGISIPGLFRELVLAELRRDGYVVDRDVVVGGPCPQGHLPLIAILEHVPTNVAGEHHDQSDQGGAASL